MVIKLNSKVSFVFSHLVLYSKKFIKEVYHLKIQYNALFINEKKKNKIILMYHSEVHTLRSVEGKNTGDIPATLTQNEYRIIPDWYYL